MFIHLLFYCDINVVAALDNKYRHSTLTSNGHGSNVVSALGSKRSGLGARSPIFLPRIKIEE